MFTFGAFAQNNDTDYFKLYKDGKNNKKKQVYLKFDQNFKRNLHATQETFVFKNTFVFVNTGKKCQAQEKIVFSNVEDLYTIEQKVLEKHIKDVQKEYGFKPVYPLEHVALKVHLIKDDDCVVLDWKRQ